MVRNRKIILMASFLFFYAQYIYIPFQTAYLSTLGAFVTGTLFYKILGMRLFCGFGVAAGAIGAVMCMALTEKKKQISGAASSHAASAGLDGEREMFLLENLGEKLKKCLTKQNISHIII